MRTYDYIILGAGASGLMLAYRMSRDPFFDEKQILIIDKQKNKGNDRTWCFWEEGSGEWDDIVTKSWPSIFFGSDQFSETIAINPYSYKMLRSKDFYSKIWNCLRLKKHVYFLEAEVQSFRQLSQGVEVYTSNGDFKTTKLFSSIPNPKSYQSQSRYPLLHQHFLGWFIRTRTSDFDNSTAIFMDFTVAQNGQTRFMYMLPMDKNTALFEYTLFSKNILKKNEYEHAIKDYLKEKGISDYAIIEKERGNIPMTAFKFWKLNTTDILYIGTSGGWTKASTGYTFNFTALKTKQLVDFLKSKNDFTKFHKPNKFWFYDLIFLDVLSKHNAEGSELFASMFQKTQIKTVFRFLDEKSTFWEDLKVIRSVPPKRFIKAFFKRIFFIS